MNVEKLENNEISAIPDENPVETIDEDIDDLDNMEMQELPMSDDNMNSIPMFQMGVQSAPNVIIPIIQVICQIRQMNNMKCQWRYHLKKIQI